ncbi:MAG: UDP-N-acetylmuramoyl-tripeptide--D-alanyl-D-alanine ligase [Candidatus Omnitrophica bacterium]|nr:UDP-N-acetylmuramoyl-tripeptide--D-alanyl-D-alanine ligase [Candidatus Omnitrophota bacterium]
MAGGERKNEGSSVFQLVEVLEAVKGRWVIGDRKRQAIGVSTDSRTIRPGDLFIAIKGDRFDGHRFLKEVVEKGAVALMISDEKAAAGIAEIPTVLVSDTRRALGDLAHWHRRNFHGPLVAVTGSCGKTSTKEMIGAIFAHRGPIVKSEGTQNNEIGVPWTLLKLRPEHWAAVVEMGMNHEGEIRCLANMAQPQLGVITNVAAAHLEGVGSVEQVAHAKCELLEALGEEGVAVLNGDDEILMKTARKYSCRKITFGFGENCDVRLREEEFPSALATPFQKANALAAIAIAQLMNIPQEGSLQILSQWRPPKGRLEVKKMGSFWAIDDTYNANPLSVRVALEFLRDFQTSGKRIAVLSDMLELGKESEKRHYRLGEEIARLGLDRVILLGQFAKEIQRGAEASGVESSVIQIASSHREALDWVCAEIHHHDVVLVKGSRRMKMETIVEGLESHVLSSAVSVA